MMRPSYAVEKGTGEAEMPDQRRTPADPGHRYQIWCKNGNGEDICIGYSDSATDFREMVEMHPVWHSWRAVDRRPPKPE
jgi:hypothetical protein